MKVVIDIEANDLYNPTEIWLVVCKDIDTNSLSIYRNITSDETEKQRFLSFSNNVEVWIGHNFLGYDYVHLNRLVGLQVPSIEHRCIDTLIISKMVDYSREGHSIEAYGIEFEFPKGKNFVEGFFDKWSQELEDYCVRDVEICHKIYNKYARVINDPSWRSAIVLEHEFQNIVNVLHSNGFCFDTSKANKLLAQVTEELNELDERIKEAFPTKTVPTREWVPRLTKWGTISKSSVPRGVQDLTAYTEGAPFWTFSWSDFNPSSHKQVIDVLGKSGWSPTEKTKTHIDTERELQRVRYKRKGDQLGSDVEKSLDLESYKSKLERLKISGWKINEANLNTLPASAPPPAKLLAKRILLESRRRTLTEWLGLVQEDGRIHGKFYGIGAWTHRMAHQQPNTANIPNEYETSGKVKLLGKEMRQLWRAPRKRLLVGVDAEGIQLRIFAHYIDDKEFTNALVQGKKEAKTDPHSLNQRILGRVCKSRAAAKRFVYALLLGGGLPKLAEILECSVEEAKEALARLLERYDGFRLLKETVIPADGKRGWFYGLDGRKVRIPGEGKSERSHLCMSGYLQNGEAIIIKKAAIISAPKIKKLDSFFVDIIHDEIQTETPNDMEIALQVAKIKADAIEEAGYIYNLKCPMKGSYWNDDHHDYTIGTNWYQTH